MTQVAWNELFKRVVYFINKPVCSVRGHEYCAESGPGQSPENYYCKYCGVKRDTLSRLE